MAAKDESRQINLSLDANKTPTLYADGYLIGSNEHVVTFNFLQAMTPDNTQQNVISRVAITRAQAKEFLDNLKDHIEKYEV